MSLAIADRAEGTAREKRTELVEALHGRIRNHQRGLLNVHLNRVTALQHGLAELDANVVDALLYRCQSALLGGLLSAQRQ